MINNGFIFHAKKPNNIDNIQTNILTLQETKKAKKVIQYYNITQNITIVTYVMNYLWYVQFTVLKSNFLSVGKNIYIYNNK